MINPEAITEMIAKATNTQRLGYYTEYLEGQIVGLSDCLLFLKDGDLTIDRCQTQINICGNADYERGLKDAYIEVGQLVKLDQIRRRRANEVSCASRYARIQQGGR